MNIISKIMVTVAAMLFLGGCVPMVAGSGLVATDMVAERRGPESFVEDNWIAWKIRSSYVKSETVQVGNINVTVYKGKVLLTGTASSKEEIRQAIAIAKKTEGVVDVASELVVQHETAKEVAEDMWITNQAKVKILADQLVRGLDIHVETTKGVVFLTGMAKTVAERDRAIGIAQSVSGVREVVSYIEIQSKAYPLAEHRLERKAGEVTDK